MKSAGVGVPILLTLIWSLATGCNDKVRQPGIEVWSPGNSVPFGRMPKFDADGARILFGDDRPGESGLWIWDMENPPQKLRDVLPPHNWDYCWSPDGSLVAFSSPAAEDDTLGGIWTVQVTTKELTRVCPSGRDVSWGSNGQKLVFHYSDDPSGQTGVYSMNYDGTGLELVEELQIRPLANPKTTAVACIDDAVSGELWVMGVGIDQWQASEVGAMQWTWSDDGNFLYFVENPYILGIIKGVLYRVEAFGSHNVDSIAGYVASPATDRDGDRVIYAKTTGTTWAGIWMRRGPGQPDVQLSIYGENPDIHPFDEIACFNLSGGGIRLIRRTK